MEFHRISSPYKRESYFNGRKLEDEHDKLYCDLKHEFNCQLSEVKDEFNSQLSKVKSELESGFQSKLSTLESKITDQLATVVELNNEFKKTIEDSFPLECELSGIDTTIQTKLDSFSSKLESRFTELNCLLNKILQDRRPTLEEDLSSFEACVQWKRKRKIIEEESKCSSQSSLPNFKKQKLITSSINTPPRSPAPVVQTPESLVTVSTKQTEYDEKLDYLCRTPVQKKQKTTEQRLSSAIKFLQEHVLSKSNNYYHNNLVLRNSNHCRYCILNKISYGSTHKEDECNWNPIFREKQLKRRLLTQCSQCGFFKECGGASEVCQARQRILQELKQKYPDNLKYIGFDLSSNTFTKVINNN